MPLSDQILHLLRRDSNGLESRSIQYEYYWVITFYADMSDRMMSLAAGLGHRQEIYSIDLSAPGYCCVSFEKEVVDWCCD